MLTSEYQKWACAVVCGVIFLLISAPFTYDATDFVTTKIGFDTVDDNGKPTIPGLILHAIVFILLARLSMFIPYDKFI